MMKRSLGVSGWVLAGLLSACGGGGGGDDGAPAGPYDVATAWQNVLTTPYSYTATGTVDGQSISLTVVNGPSGGPITYPRDPSNTLLSYVDQTVTVAGGGLSESLTARSYFSGSASVIGVSYSDGSCSDVTNSLPLPTAAALGASGPLYIATGYDSCSLIANPVGSEVATWSVNDYSGVPYFCVNTTESINGVLDVSGSQCVEVRADGSLGSRVRVSIQIPGQPEIVLRGG
jgi:hypothetical protein